MVDLTNEDTVRPLGCADVVVLAAVVVGVAVVVGGAVSACCSMVTGWAGASGRWALGRGGKVGSTHAVVVVVTRKVVVVVGGIIQVVRGTVVAVVAGAGGIYTSPARSQSQ